MLRMKTLLAACTLAVMSGAAAAAANCDLQEGCAAHACRLQRDVEAAQARNDAKTLAKLQKAQAGMAHCSDDGLRLKRQKALDQAQVKINQRTNELAQAQASGDPKKIAKAQKKLDSANAAYKDVQNSPL